MPLFVNSLGRKKVDPNISVEAFHYKNVCTTNAFQTLLRGKKINLMQMKSFFGVENVIKFLQEPYKTDKNLSKSYTCICTLDKVDFCLIKLNYISVFKPYLV